MDKENCTLLPFSMNLIINGRPSYYLLSKSCQVDGTRGKYAVRLHSVAEEDVFLIPVPLFLGLRWA